MEDERFRFPVSTIFISRYRILTRGDEFVQLQVLSALSAKLEQEQQAWKESGR